MYEITNPLILNVSIYIVGKKSACTPCLFRDHFVRKKRNVTCQTTSSVSFNALITRKCTNLHSAVIEIIPKEMELANISLPLPSLLLTFPNVLEPKHDWFRRCDMICYFYFNNVHRLRTWFRDAIEQFSAIKISRGVSNDC